jgi:hypothetical protein
MRTQRRRDRGFYVVRVPLIPLFALDHGPLTRLLHEVFLCCLSIRVILLHVEIISVL